MSGAPYVRRAEPPETPLPTLAGNMALGVTQIILWGGTFFLVAVVSGPIVASTGWPQAMVVGALSLAIFVSGLPAPFVGRMIRRHGGRPMLVIGAVIVAAGLALMAVAPTLPVFLLAWVIAGLGMSASLYDPLFAAIGQAYGTAARGAMTQIAISSGFAVSLCWPATSFLVEQVGWRGACLTYAALCALVVAPLYAWALPSLRRTSVERAEPPRPYEPAGSQQPARLPAERLLAVTFAMAAMIMTAVSVQLLQLLQTMGVASTTAVALTGLIGPAQVGVRVVEPRLRAARASGLVPAPVERQRRARPPAAGHAPVAGVARHAALRGRQRHAHRGAGHAAAGALRTARICGGDGPPGAPPAARTGGYTRRLRLHRRMVRPRVAPVRDARRRNDQSRSVRLRLWLCLAPCRRTGLIRAAAVGARGRRPCRRAGPRYPADHPGGSPCRLEPIRHRLPHPAPTIPPPSRPCATSRWSISPGWSRATC
ncbi:MFS transporter [Methylobacterium sp. P31]